MLWHVFIQLDQLDAGCCLTDVDLILKVVLLGFAGVFWREFHPAMLKSWYFLVCVHGIQKWQKDTLLMKNNKWDQRLYFLSCFLLLSHLISSIPTLVPLFSHLTSSFFKSFLLNFSLFMILLCLLVLFTHLPCKASSLLCVLHTYRGLQPMIKEQNALLFHALTSMIPFYTFQDLQFWISFSLFFVLLPLPCPLVFCSLPTHSLQAPSNLACCIH